MTDETVDLVRAEIAHALSRISGKIVGLSSLAAGADQVFADQVLAVGGDLYVIQPCRDYIETFTERDSREHFTRLVKLATAVEVLPFIRPSEDAFLAAGFEIARRVDRLFAVWDGKPSRGRGGTGDIVNYADSSAKGSAVTIVWPSGSARSSK
ncbi:hypothetical protein [Pseudonocardia ammonioxydans]|uniref:hypothetical protein n=1 Tax=Pseudonocardia ammonioxydans TaxID=260086 RepID=UPI001160A147|nr:hypothetical protein [Pseudonocardia ammonioxydans]